jgi:hypothetical protein
MSDWTTIAVQDKAYDARSTVSCVGRGVFRFSNTNTRFNQEVPQPLAGHDGQVKYTLVTLEGTYEDLQITAEASPEHIQFSYSKKQVRVENESYGLGNRPYYKQLHTLNVCLKLREGVAVDIAEMSFMEFYASEIEDHMLVFYALQTALSVTESDTQDRKDAQLFFNHLLHGGYSD